MLTHSGEKPFRCDQCTYSWTSAQILKRHLLNHTGEKPFTCKQCSYSCKHSNGFKYHMLSHTDKKPFACKQCNYSCKLSNQLKNHIRKHSVCFKLSDFPDCITCCPVFRLYNFWNYYEKKIKCLYFHWDWDFIKPPIEVIIGVLDNLLMCTYQVWYQN